VAAESDHGRRILDARTCTWRTGPGAIPSSGALSPVRPPIVLIHDGVAYVAEAVGPGGHGDTQVVDLRTRRPRPAITASVKAITRQGYLLFAGDPGIAAFRAP